MISKCANPNCDAELRYLRSGKLFVFDKHTHTPGPYGGPGHGRTHEFFWLCEQCLRTLTMRYDRALHLPVVVSNEAVSNEAVSASSEEPISSPAVASAA